MTDDDPAPESPVEDPAPESPVEDPAPDSPVDDPTPERVVQGHLDAYNDGDAAAFAAHFGPDATVGRLRDGEVHAEGRADIREQYAELFAAEPALHCEVTDRLSLGEYVVWAERVERSDGTTEALAVYRVADGLIRELWLG